MPRGDESKFSSWMQHLNAYRAKHPDKSMRECMKEASNTYKKQSPKTRPVRKKV